MATKKKTIMMNEYESAPITLSDHPFYGLDLDVEQKQFRDAIWDPNIDIVFCNSKAGTGKTLIAVGTANLLVQYGKFDSITYVVAPTQEEKSGFLPGSDAEKTMPYMAPLFDALTKLGINPFTAVNQMSAMNQKNGTGYIDAMSHLWLRGCNLENTILIVEESQNFYVDELKKVLTRACEKSKVIVIGHSKQIDLYHNPERSGFVPYVEHFRGMDKTAICELNTNHRSWVANHADELIFDKKGD